MIDTQPSQTGFFHFQIKHGTRSKGHNALAAAAYRSGTISFHCERNGRRYAFPRKSEVVCGGIVAPHGCPSHLKRRDLLWNAVENSERRNDSQLFIDLVLGIPRGLTVEQNVVMATSFLEEHFAQRGMIADWSYHDPIGKNNPHLHVMVTQRVIDADSPTGFGKKDRSWNDRALAENWRAGWADAIRTAYESAGISSPDVDHRSFKRRGIDRQPTRHHGRRTPGNARRWDAIVEENQLIMMHREIKDAQAMERKLERLKVELERNQNDLLDAAAQAGKDVMDRESPRPRPETRKAQQRIRAKSIVALRMIVGESPKI